MPHTNLNAKVIMSALIDLNKLQDEYSLLRPKQYTAKKKYEEEIAEVRKGIPAPILSHHDRIRIRRASTKAVTNWVCMGCHIAVPMGLRTKLAQDNDIVVCENCGAYMYLPEDEKRRLEEEAEAPKKRKKTVKKAVKKATKKK